MYLIYFFYIVFSLYIFRVILIIVPERPKGAWTWTWSVIFNNHLNKRFMLFKKTKKNKKKRGKTIMFL